MFSANVVEFEEPGVSVVEFASGVSYLCGIADGSEKLVDKCDVDSIEAFASIVEEARVFVAE